MACPLIIKVAINGWFARETNPNIPLSANLATASCTACFKAGAQIIHARAVGAFRPLQRAYRDAILYPILPGDGLDINMDDRYARMHELRAARLLKMAPIIPES